MTAPAQTPPARRETRTARAYETLKRMIMENELEAGQSYLEQALAARLGISRTPLREAALRLAGEGFVTIRPRLGIQIRPISARDMEEIYDILAELEPYAAARLAARGLDPSDLETLEATVREMETAVAAGNLAAWAGADRRFHQVLIELAGNERLTGIVSTLWDQVHRARMATLRLRTNLGKSNDDHRALVERIAAGDARGAARAHRRHRERAGRELLALLRRHGIGAL